MQTKEDIIQEIKGGIVAENDWFDLDWIQEHLPEDSDILDSYRNSCEKLSEDLLLTLSLDQLKGVKESIQKDVNATNIWKNAIQVSGILDDVEFD
jgi:hypothetical protein